ncbi:helix-turn-helix domain-containing protein [Nocardia sp. NPDC006044]|uniref:helix-turn-helix domain-containing protein n=1 Tax=Nocardia sp. NPDC006044 TaxID=3364306 RepID=UPI003697865B
MLTVDSVTAMLRPVPVVTADLVEATVPVPESLRPWFTELGRIPPVRDLAGSFAHVPQAATTIVLRSPQGGTREALVIGPQTKALYSHPSKPASCLRLRLAHGAARPLLGVPAALLTDRVVRLADLPGVAAGLAGELIELSADDIFRFLEDTLPQRVSEDATRRAQREVLRSAVAALSADPNGRSMRALAAEVAVSERQLRNLFTAGIGVSPKHFARIDRVRRIVTQARTTPLAQSPLTTSDYESKKSLAQLAADHGYFDQSKAQVPPTSLAHLAVSTGFYDQSHMTSDFRSLMGTTPDRFFKGRLPAPTPCRPLARI